MLCVNSQVELVVIMDDFLFILINFYNLHAAFEFELHVYLYFVRFDVEHAFYTCLCCK